jgi:hypothetical protein
MRTARVGNRRALGAIACGLAIASASAAITIEVSTDQAQFIARLGGAAAVRTVGFDDVDTSTGDWTAFAVDRYQASHGLRLTGESGQYASRAFGSPAEFIPVSSPNTYAPGPVDTRSTSGTAGGNETTATFSVAGGAARTAGFGCFFVDADWPDWPTAGAGACTLTAYDQAGNALGTSGPVVTPGAQSRFAGLVAVDSGSGLPTTAIARVHLTNGSGWPCNDENEGAVIDDVVFATPVGSQASVSAVQPPEGTVGTLITLDGLGLGAARGKVSLVAAKNVALKVGCWSDARIQCTLGKALPPATYDLLIVPKKPAAPLTLPAGFAVKAPKINLVEPVTATPGQAVTLYGEYFGIKKGKVTLASGGGAPVCCKVLSWEMDPATGDSAARIAVPQAPAGTYTVTILTKVAPSPGASTLTIP